MRQLVHSKNSLIHLKLLFILFNITISYIHSSEIQKSYTNKINFIDPQITNNLLEKPKFGSQMTIYQFPNQEEYLLILQGHITKESFCSVKMYKGTASSLNELFCIYCNFSEIYNGKKVNSLHISTTIGDFTSDQHQYKNPSPCPAWYDELKQQYIPLTPYIPTEEFLNKMKMKDINIEDLKALAEKEMLK